ncbi:MAG TPA: hypothetical protein VI728_08060 [Syntrophales bacterium]|nr:hypothetical protein [Syntrophales bacterium]
MPNNEIKAPLVMELFNNRGTIIGQSLSKLLDILIQELRERNDHAVDVEVHFNQGEIRAYQRLKLYLERGFPVKQQK